MYLSYEVTLPAFASFAALHALTWTANNNTWSWFRVSTPFGKLIQYHISQASRLPTNTQMRQIRRLQNYQLKDRGRWGRVREVAPAPNNIIGRPMDLLC
jgi:hypothetical protein